MAGLLYVVLAWLVALVAIVGMASVMTMTDAPGDSEDGSETTALATGLFVAALVASMTL